MKHSRYQRQILLKEINDAGQTRIRNAKVLLVGMGGLNSPAALYLSAAGIGTIGIIDDDCVDISNLHRQIIFNEQDEGTHKVSAAKEKITKLNSEVEVIKYKERLTEKNVENLFSTFDVIVDGSDNFETKFLINDAAYKTGKTVIYGSVNQFEGQVAIFSPSDGPCYRCFHPEKPKAKIQNCAEAGVLGSVVGIIGSMQATAALEFLISKNLPDHPLKPEFGILSVMDFRGAWSFSRLKISKQPQCKTCSKPTNEIILESNVYSCSVVAEISSETLKKICQESEKKIYLIDVREIEEWQEGHLENAIHWPLSQLRANNFPALPINHQIVVYCQGGIRSSEAIQLMAHLNVPMFNLKQGLHSWPLPLIRD